MNEKIHIKIIEEPIYAAIASPLKGLTLDQFDRNGLPRIEGLLLMEIIGRSVIFNYKDEKGSQYFDFDRLTNEALCYTSSVRFCISRDVYREVVPFHSLVQKLSLGYVGKSSVAFVSQIFRPGSQDLVCELTVQLVFVDKVNHKPQPLHDGVRQKFEGRWMLTKGLRVVPKSKPQNTFTREIVVKWTDTDEYNHCNFASYVRFSTDSIREALRQREKLPNSPVGQADSDDPLKCLTESVVDNGIKEVDLCYLRECLEGDVLKCHLWQEEGEICKVISSIFHGNVEVFQMHLEYYGSQES